ncbi:MAG: hypothetical protein ACNA8S_15805 [Deferrisomatales bacterium]
MTKKRRGWRLPGRKERTDYFEIAGVRYAPVLADVMTARQRLACRWAIRHADLDNVRVMPGETPEAYAERLFRRVTVSGGALELMGALLLPEGLSPKDWSPAVAAATAAALGRIRTPEDKVLFDGMLLSIVAGFHQAGMARAKDFPILAPPDSPAHPAEG